MQRDIDWVANAVELHFSEAGTAAGAEQVADLHEADLARCELLAEHQHSRLSVVEAFRADDVVPLQGLFELDEILGGI